MTIKKAHRTIGNRFRIFMVPLPILSNYCWFIIPNFCMRERCNFKRALRGGGPGGFVLKSLSLTFEWRPIEWNYFQPDPSRWTVPLKVHKIEVFLASILKFVLFHCKLYINIKFLWKNFFDCASIGGGTIFPMSNFFFFFHLWTLFGVDRTE
jgi:hypothetical protein